MADFREGRQVRRCVGPDARSGWTSTARQVFNGNRSRVRPYVVPGVVYNLISA